MIKHISGDLRALIAISSNQISLEFIAFVMYLLRWDLVLIHYVVFSSFSSNIHTTSDLKHL